MTNGRSWCVWSLSREHSHQSAPWQQWRHRLQTSHLISLQTFPLSCHRRPPATHRPQSVDTRPLLIIIHAFHSIMPTWLHSPQAYFFSRFSALRCIADTCKEWAISIIVRWWKEDKKREIERYHFTEIAFSSFYDICKTQESRNEMILEVSCIDVIAMIFNELEENVLIETKNNRKIILDSSCLCNFDYYSRKYWSMALSSDVVSSTLKF